ncbi:hypothetical protein BOX15_Mlig025963g2 [Macrostomum lignano]|uniref:Uncharacterized protein n=2 Tax=Macrostomum lignano TaxID=282301 RepID=A0A267FVF1_9PLAT|nr:hypothetical protein BOX15_Mlig025963g2 [Macrostomum lignano]
MSDTRTPITYEDPDRLLKLNRDCLENPSPPYPHFETPGEALSYATYRLTRPLHPNETRFNAFGLPRPNRLFGNVFQRPPLDNHHLHWMSGQFTMQGRDFPKHCHIMERDLYRCLSRVGVQNLHKWCRIYFDDYDECSNHYKEMKRYRYLQRMMREKNMEPLPTPPYDSYWPRHS